MYKLHVNFFKNITFYVSSFGNIIYVPWVLTKFECGNNNYNNNNL